MTLTLRGQFPAEVGLGPYLFSDSGSHGAGSGAHRPHGFQNGWHSLHSHHRQRGDRPLCCLAQPDGTSAGCRQYRSPHPEAGSRGLRPMVVSKRPAGSGLTCPYLNPSGHIPHSHHHRSKEPQSPGIPPQNTQSIQRTRHLQGALGLQHSGVYHEGEAAGSLGSINLPLCT